MSVGSILKSIKSEREENTAEQEHPEPVNWFHGEDPLREARSRIERTGQVSFPEEWEDESKFQEGEKALIEQKIQEIEDDLSNLGYNFPDYSEKDVEIQHKKESPSKHLGRYDSRSNLGAGVPLHRINPNFENFDSRVLAPTLHEHGHDIHSELIEEQIDDERLFEETLNEFVAELTMLEYMPEAYADNYTRNPHNSDYKPAFRGLEDLLSPELREKELEIVEEIESELDEEDTDYQAIERLSEELINIEPFTGRFETSKKDFDKRENMFLDKFAHGYIQDKRFTKKVVDYLSDTMEEADDIRNSWSLEEQMGNLFYSTYSDPTNMAKRNEGAPVRRLSHEIERFMISSDEDYREIAEEMRDEKKEVNEKLRNGDSITGRAYTDLQEASKELTYDWYSPRAKNDRIQELEKDRHSEARRVMIEKPYDLADHLISSSLSQFKSTLNDVVEEINSGRGKSEMILEDVSDIRYGYEDGDWDEWFDFPHEVGCGMAHRLYKDGDVELRDVVENPQQYLEKCKNEIYDVMGTRIENPEGLPDEENPYV